MNQTLDIMGGAYTAELIKGQWKYTPNMNIICKAKPPVERKQSMKEKPQYSIITEYENSAIKNFQVSLRSTTLEIVKYLKSI